MIVTLEDQVLSQAKTAKQAARQMTTLSTSEKNEALLKMGQALWEERQSIIEANQKDIRKAREQGIAEARIDRLMITEERLKDMIEGLEQIIQLSDPIGQVLEEIQHPKGMVIEKIRVPFGVIAMVYESRPNVTVDAAGLAIKTGNAVVLRGGKEALQSNQALVTALKKGLHVSKVPTECIQLIQRIERETVDILIRAKGIVDLAIPRGGAGLIQRVVKYSQIPVIETGVGNCHIYIHESANPQMAKEIVINAKTQRPSVCNAMETLLVESNFAKDHLLSIITTLQERGVEIRGCGKTQEIIKNPQVLPATSEDYLTEHLDLILTVKVVDSLDEAIDHIEKYGTKHSEAIIAEDKHAVEQFLNRIDAAAVFHNVSTRYTDGFEFGFGAEIGISTQKLHARGPMGLPELTSYKYVIKGTGQIRE